ncbi:MAG TPA: hypothetical protein VGR24_00210 [bacterium]|nr:hypothetical protein [bacterium]
MSENALASYRHKIGRTLRRSRVGRVVYESARRLRGEVRVALHAWRAGVLTHAAGRPDADLADRQRPLRWSARLPGFSGPEALRDWLVGHGIVSSEGRHTFYLPPQPELAGLFPEAAGFYPADAGFKILKDPGSPEESRYVGAGQTTTLQTRLTGSPRRQVLAAGYLAMHGIGPAIYDMAEITTADGGSLTAFVVQDAGRDVPTMEEYRAFMSALEERLQSGELAVIPPNWRQRGDFSPPDCARNLVKSGPGGTVRYVDFQQFLVTDQRLVVRRLLEAASGELHFGTAYAARGGKYLYQSVPLAGETAKRDTQLRWRMMSALLKRHGIDPDLRIFFDVGCNAGMMLAEALAAGARWGIGWDLPRVIEHARRLQLALGNTRLDMIGAQLHAAYPLAEDVPERLRRFTDDAVVLYLAVRQHLGFMPTLAGLRWRYLLYEGHQGESPETIPVHMESLARVVPVRMIDTTAYADGDSRPRPVALVERVG